MNLSEIALFLSGLFFGGAVDHAILAMKRSELTPYGLAFGVKGNWGLAGFDFVLALVSYALHRRLRYRS